MKLTHVRSVAFATLATLGASAHAIVVDGTAESGYGSALFTQTVGTGFGNSNTGSPVTANGSELDGFYGVQDATNLYGVGTGNLESNFNKAVFFFDTGSGGFNTIGNNNASTADFDFLNSLSGLTFDTGFNASYALWFRNGSNAGAPNAVYATLARLGPTGTELFDLSSTETGDTAIRTTSTTGFASALNNSNLVGVDGNVNGSSSGSGVTTGIEFSLAKSLLGNPTGAIRVAGFISGGNYLSNQVVGGLATGTNNLTGAGTVNFAQIGGNQFVSVAAPVPEPASMTALALGGLAFLRRRKKSA